MEKLKKKTLSELCEKRSRYTQGIDVVYLTDDFIYIVFETFKFNTSS